MPLPREISFTMKTAVVILNWNTNGYLEKFVPGILHSLEGTDAELVVADSASTDGSMEMMAEKFPEVRRITLDKNYGFTGGYNRALSMIEAEYYVLINSDIEVQDGWLQPLTETLDRNPEVGACAPKLHSWYEKDMFEYAGAAGGYLDSFGFPLCRGRIMNMVEKDEGQYDSPADVFWATGACLMIRSSLFRELGGLDDRFFAHMEEIDLCWRLQLNGYRIRIVPQSTVYHLGGGTLPQTSPWKLKLNYRNNLLMLENNLARTIALQGLSDKVNADANDLKKLAVKACRKARCLIFKRMVIDGAAAAAYLLTLKPSFFKAVVNAHAEYRKMAVRTGPEDIDKYLRRWCGSGERPVVRGIFPHWIIPMALVRGKRTFSIVARHFGQEQNSFGKK